jgi:glyoxylase-like metal-dependent hydrolase (beta-lactamase superfamily II)
MKFVKHGLVSILCAGLLASMPAFAVAPDNYRHFSWEEVAPGVWFGLTLPNSFQTGNVAIVTLPSGGSMVVDTQDAEFIGREILEKAREVGHGPVKYVVNTHMHQDHVGGNEAFVRDNPKVEIIAHRNACAGIQAQTIPRMQQRLPGLTKGLEDMRAKRAAMPSGADTAALDRRIEGTALYLAEAKDFKWAMPNECLDLKPGQEKVITDGGRRIEIRYFGPAHSNGDLVVFLPKEKVAMVGDLWGVNTGYKFLDAGLDGRDGSVLDTPVVLKRVRALDFDVALTGHSPIAHGKASLDEAITDGEQIIAQIEDAAAHGDTVSTTLQKMPAPANAPPFVADVWRSIVTNVFDNIHQSARR